VPYIPCLYTKRAEVLWYLFRLLDKEDPEAAQIIKAELQADGVLVFTNCSITQITHSRRGGYLVKFQQGSSNLPPSEQKFDALLVAAGPSLTL